MKCKHCSAEVPDDKDETLAAAHWGWTLVADDPAHCDRLGLIPSAYYACPNCSDDDQKDAFRSALAVA